MDTFYAIKHHQQHTYDEAGKRQLVTALLAQPVTITQIKQVETDGYAALQVGIGNKKKLGKPLTGHLKKAAVTPRYLREIALKAPFPKGVADTIAVDEVLAVGDRVSVHSVSKGKGFAGTVKRWNFKGGPKTHGQSDRHRAPGSIGQGTTPGRVYKGKKMAGHMGSAMIAVQGARVMKVDNQTQTLWVTGSVPGHKGTLVRIQKHL